MPAKDSLGAVLKAARVAEGLVPPSLRAADKTTWVPHQWEDQARDLSWASAGALSVCRFGLSKRLRPSALGQVRYIFESHALLQWLLEVPAERPRRALGLALAEVEDWLGTMRNRSSDPEARKEFEWQEPRRAIEQERLEELKAQLLRRASSEGVEPARRPKVQTLTREMFGDNTPSDSFRTSVVTRDLAFRSFLEAPEMMQRVWRQMKWPFFAPFASLSLARCTGAAPCWLPQRCMKHRW